jgi:tight adherence protein B
VATTFVVAAARSTDGRAVLRRVDPTVAGRPRREHLGDAFRSLFRRPLVVVSMAGIGGYLVGGRVLGVVAAGIGTGLPRWIRRRKRTRTADVLEDQLGTAVSGIAAALRAGLSLSQALRYAAAECRPPVSEELRAVCDREDLGLPIDESLGRWAAAASSSEVRLVANALRLRIGSGLPPVLAEIGRALRQRRTVAREVRSLTAQARLSGSILAILPIGFFAFLSLTSRHDMATAFSTPAGLAAIAGGLVLQGGGYLWIRRLIRIDA